VEKPALQVFRDSGYNWVRYRLWHTPTWGAQNLDYVIARAKEAKKLGFKFLLNYHYSDTWADPLNQPIPKAWEGMDADKMANALFEYTRDTIIAFRNAGVLPDVNAIVMSVANGRGKGVYWWEPGNNGARGFFDADGNTLPVFDVFRKYTRPIHRTDGQ